jgi:hypothetical protein
MVQSAVPAPHYSTCSGDSCRNDYELHGLLMTEECTCSQKDKKQNRAILFQEVRDLALESNHC